MKIKIAISTLLLLSFLSLSSILKPSIKIKNNTNEKIRIYVMERVISDNEPSIAEVDQLKKVRTLNPLEELIINPSITTLLHKNKEIDIGWRTMPHDKINTKVGYKWFLMTTKEGTCDYSLTINKNNYTLKKEHSYLCIKRLISLPTAKIPQ